MGKARGLLLRLLRIFSGLRGRMVTQTPAITFNPMTAKPPTKKPTFGSPLPKVADGTNKPTTDTATQFSFAFGTSAKKRDSSGETESESHQAPSFGFTFGSAPTENSLPIFNFSPSPNKHTEDTKPPAAIPSDFWDDDDDGELICTSRFLSDEDSFYR